MGVLQTMRETLAADLAVLGVPIHPTWPVDIDAPCVFVAPPLAGENYVSGGQAFGYDFVVLLDVVIMVEHGPAEEAIAALETLLEAALVNTADWALVRCDPPTPTTVTDGGSQYLSVVLHLSKPFQL